MSTIVSISTAIGKGAISIVRLSGDEAISIVNKCFKGKNLTKALSHTINYGYIIDENKEIIDENIYRAILDLKNNLMYSVKPYFFIYTRFKDVKTLLHEAKAVLDLLEERIADLNITISRLS